MISLVNGERVATVGVNDSSVLRGDGCFEAIRSYRGVLFRLDDHLDRLATSAAALALDVPPRPKLEEWATTVADEGGDCIVRVVLTRGGAVAGVSSPPLCIVMGHALPKPMETLTLEPVAAPWHPAGRAWDLAGAKTISYAPNLAAIRQARGAGADDALLLSDDSFVLEGPTFSVGFFKAGSLYTPSLDLGILESVTRRVVGEVMGMGEVMWVLDDLAECDEVFVMSTVKEITPVTRIGEMTFPSGESTRELAQRFGAKLGHRLGSPQPR